MIKNDLLHKVFHKNFLDQHLLHWTIFPKIYKLKRVSLSLLNVSRKCLQFSRHIKYFTCFQLDIKIKKATTYFCATGCKCGETIRDRKDAARRRRASSRRWKGISERAEEEVAAFPYVFVRFSPLGQPIPFFIIFTAELELVAKASAYLPERAVAIKHRPAAQIRLSHGCFPAPYNISLRNS